MKYSLAAAVLLSGAAASGASAPPVSPPLARVNGEAIAGAEVIAEFTRLHGGPAKFPGGDVEARKFLELAIDRRLFLQEAYRLGFDEKEDVRKAADAYRDTKALEYLLRTEVDEKAIPTPEEIRQAWERNSSVLYELKIIEVPAGEDADAVYLAILSGRDFDGVARSCSVAPSRVYGGKVPLVGWGTLDPALESAAFSLEPGDTAPPVKTAAGWEIVRMEGIHPVERPDFEETRLKIEGILRKRKLEARRVEYATSLSSKYHAYATAAAGSVSALADALSRAPESAVEAWDGGALAVKDFVSKRELESLARMPPARAEDLVQQRLRRRVNDALARREAKERRIAENPEVARDVKAHREDLMARALDADDVVKGLSVSDEEVRADFENHRTDWTTPERRRVAQILVKTREEARQIREKLDAGESFAELARKQSLDAQTKTIGGDLGWITKKDVPAAFLPVLTFKTDQVSDPIESKLGWHLIRVTAIEAPKPMTFDQAKEEVRKSALERMKTARRAEWVAKLRAGAKIKVDEKNLHEFAKAHAA